MQKEMRKEWLMNLGCEHQKLVVMGGGWKVEEEEENGENGEAGEGWKPRRDWRWLRSGRERTVFNFCCVILARRDEDGQTGKTGALTTHQTTTRIVAMGKTSTVVLTTGCKMGCAPPRRGKRRGKRRKGGHGNG